MKGRVMVVGRRAIPALVLVILGSALTPGDGQEDLTPQRVHLELQPLATGVDRATSPGGGRVGDLAVGDSEVWTLAVSLEHDRPGQPRDCRYDVNMPAFPVQEIPAGAAHVWEARLTVREASLEKIELDIDWKRYVRAANGERRAVAGDSATVTFGEGEHRLLDFVRMREVPGWESCYDSLALELEARVAEASALADRRIAYDLWLVDEGPGGSSTTRRWQVLGKHGESRDFDFEPVHLALPGGGTLARLDTQVSGAVRGRVRDDGSLEVALSAHRTDGPDDGRWSIGGYGEKRVRIAAGEAIRLELPAPNPDVSREREGSTLKKDVERGVLAGLQDRRVALVLTARVIE